MGRTNDELSPVVQLYNGISRTNHISYKNVI